MKMVTPNVGKMYWNDEECEILISMVQDYPEIWDKEHTNYKDNRSNRRNKIWVSIGTHLIDKDEIECKRKWGNIRFVYIFVQKYVAFN